MEQDKIPLLILVRKIKTKSYEVTKSKQQLH